MQQLIAYWKTTCDRCSRVESVNARRKGTVSEFTTMGTFPDGWVGFRHHIYCPECMKKIEEAIKGAIHA
jgi:hypothetical protein